MSKQQIVAFTQKHKGSILAYSLIILAMMMVIVISISTSSIIEKKAASGTEFSMQSLQTADSGTQLALNAIRAGGNVAALAASLSSGSCDAGTGKVSANGPVGSKYELTFLKSDDVTPVACTGNVSEIASIKSIGTYKGTARAVSIKVSGNDNCVVVCGTNNSCVHDGIVYGTVTALDGKCWLDRNLGAKQGAKSFSGEPTVSSYNDQDGYGWLFQWGRKADGHQYTAWGAQPSPALSGAVAGPVGTSVVSPPDDKKAIIVNTSPHDWLSPGNNSLWTGVGAVNNPCPAGFRLPTQGEWTSLYISESIAGEASAYNSSLKLTTAGYRYNSMGIDLAMQGSAGYYWSGDSTGNDSYYFSFASALAIPPVTNHPRVSSFSVRCIKN